MYSTQITGESAILMSEKKVKRWKIFGVFLQIAGIIPLIFLVLAWYSAIQNVPGLVIFPFRNEILGLSIVGLFLIICGAIIISLRSR
jgi:hypothetical protein